MPASSAARRSPSAMRRAAIVLAVVIGLLSSWTPVVSASAATLGELKAQLASLRKEAAPAAAAFEKALDQVEGTQRLIARTDARIVKQTAKLAAAEERLGMRADALYRQGGDMGIAEFLLGAASWEDFTTRLDYASLIASSDAALVKEVKDTRLALRTERARLAGQAKTERGQLAAARTRKNAMYARLQAVQARYDGVLASIAARMAVDDPDGSSYPPGPNGMVFPVRGAYYYANTWGAARSGGRRHKGTDIMARHGTPVVAMASGRVNAHSNGLGGLTITLSGDNGWSFYYAHLQGYAVRSGHVRAGQVIGYVGSTGNARGGAPHLHLQIGPHGNWVNPYPYLRAAE